MNHILNIILIVGIPAFIFMVIIIWARSDIQKMKGK